MMTRSLLFEAISDFPEEYYGAWSLADMKHYGTFRKFGSHDPYIVHPEGVAKVVMAYGGTDEEAKAALCHDLVEDTDVTIERIAYNFGDEVAGIVSFLTNNPDEVKRLGKEEYMNKKLCMIPPSALFVKLADMLYNTVDHASDSQLERMYRNLIYLQQHRRGGVPHRCMELYDTVCDAAETELKRRSRSRK